MQRGWRPEPDAHRQPSDEAVRPDPRVLTGSYNVPCIAFINKLDRAGADPMRVLEQLK